MADTFGLLALPASTTDVPVGDPSLAKLGAYLQAVVNFELTAAWLILRPRTPTQEQPAIKSVFLYDPDELSLNTKNLPALFVYRDSGAIEQQAEGWYEDTTVVRALWVFPPEPAAKQKPRNPFVNAIEKAVANALQRWRHPSWVDSGDTDPYAATVAASANSFLLSKPTSTSPVTYSGAGLDGAIGANVCSPRLNVQINTAPAVGAYNTSAPIVVTYLDALGRTTSKSLTPTLPNGGEHLSVGRDAGQLVSLAFPGQSGTNGAFSVGNAAFAGRGSALLDRAMLEYAYLRTWKLGPVQVEVLDDQGRVTDKLNYPAVQMALEIREHQYVDLTVTPRFEPLASGGAGVDVAISKDSTNGGWVDNGSFPDHGI